MSTIPQNNQNENEILDYISNFVKKFQLGKLLFKCNAGKEKGIAVMDIFRYLLNVVFSGRSMYMQMKTDTFDCDFCKNTVYRFLNSTKTNWQKFTTLASANVIVNFMKPLTDDKRQDVFIVDDSLFDRSRSKKTELLANVFDHCSMKFKKGFRMLTLGWSDGNSFVPINYSLLSAAEDKNLICNANKYDGRSIAGKRRIQSRRKATDVMIELIRSAQNAGHSAKYVLFDSWFSSPKTLTSIKNDLKLDTIAMLKRGNTKYEYDGKMMTISKIYNSCRKRPGRSKYLLCVDVMIHHDDSVIPAKIIFVRNKSNKSDWLALISTDTNISSEETIRIYGKRWDIEVFFKSCKSYLRLVKECRSISYDALNAHVAIVFTRYMILSVAKRENNDDRTICELCYVMMDELEDITFTHSMQIILNALIDSVMEYFHITESQLEEFTSIFIGKLPQNMREALLRVA